MILYLDGCNGARFNMHNFGIKLIINLKKYKKCQHSVKIYSCTIFVLLCESSVLPVSWLAAPIGLCTVYVTQHIGTSCRNLFLNYRGAKSKYQCSQG